MNKIILALVAVVTAVAAAPSDEIFELHVEASAKAATAKAWALRGKGGAVEMVFLDAAVLLDRRAIASANVEPGPDGAPQIRLVLTSEGGRKLQEITARSVGRRLGIVLEGQLRAAPYVAAPVAGGVLVVGGSFAAAEAAELARKLGPPAPTGSNGRVGGQAEIAAPRAGAREEAELRGLQGDWTVLNATMDGRLRDDPKLTGATWSFRENELVVADRNGQSERFSVRMEGGGPGAFRLEPIPPSKERGGWVLFAREGSRLNLAFGDNLEGRPDGFAPAPKKIVMKLARKTGGAAPAPCEILEGAGISKLLPGGVRPPDRELRAGGPACVFSDSRGQEVRLMLVPAAGRTAFEREVEAARKKPRQRVQDEPALGPSAVSLTQGYRVSFLVLQRETLVAVSFELAGADVGELKQFTRRVLARVPSDP